MKWRRVLDIIILLIAIWWIIYTPPGKEIRRMVWVWVTGEKITPKMKFVSANILLDADFQWKLKAMDGSIMDLSQSRGKVIFIHFLSTSCILCLQKIPILQDLYDTYKGKVTFLLVSQDTSPDNIFDFMRANNYTIPVYAPINPPTRKLSNANRVSWIFIDKDGMISIEKLGTQTPTKDQIVKKLETLLTP
ncbi:MAG: TlpA family protein disulfide reductase [Flavobacteriales bacterium AspAUS03]